MSVQFCLALLVLSSLTAAHDPECDELIKPLLDKNKIFGKWTLFAATTDQKESMEGIKSITSSWIEFSPGADTDEVNLYFGDKMNGKCHYGKSNFTFTGNMTKVTFSYNGTSHDHFGKHLETCPDCMLWIDESEAHWGEGETMKSRSLYLFTKSGKLDEANLNVAQKQAACLKLKPELHYGEATDLCPDKKANKEPPSTTA